MRELITAIHETKPIVEATSTTTTIYNPKCKPRTEHTWKILHTNFGCINEKLIGKLTKTLKRRGFKLKAIAAPYSASRGSVAHEVKKGKVKTTIIVDWATSRITIPHVTPLQHTTIQKTLQKLMN